MRPFPDIHVIVTNVSDSAITLPEIGGYELAAGAEVDMMDETLPSGHYTDHRAVLRALNDLTGTVLYQQREAGNLEYRLEPVVS
jgi:hypothetical protein